MDTLRDTAIRVALIYKKKAKPVECGHAATGARRPEIRGMSRYSWGRPRVTRRPGHDTARSSVDVPS